MAMQRWCRAAVLAALALVAGCAAEVKVVPAQLAPLARPAPDVVVASDLPVRLSTGYTRTVPQKTRWRAVGTLAQGTVYQPLDTVFAIEGRHVHEAWLVLRGADLQGFWLPAENHYSGLERAIPMTLEGGAPR
ncbi:hypothetical protein H8N03_19695 [Ramlibacter sp. USB13]|uniref:Uncharacterized protein n=1 Tax=Ramlibacter cellulosilyticus TaxID=2764187 RepID=A0A923MTM4_9BURK|nr:hypothetical protein [Ramlibacter cellulosilyticus]MBC5785180.1 hypothetical protein [Ramlibacter cellulosilyticus]